MDTEYEIWHRHSSLWNYLLVSLPDDLGDSGSTQLKVHQQPICIVQHLIVAEGV